MTGPGIMTGMESSVSEPTVTKGDILDASRSMLQRQLYVVLQIGLTVWSRS